MQFSCSVTKSCLTLWDPMNCSKPGFPGFMISQNLLKFMSIESLMPSNHLLLCCPLLLLPSIFPCIRVFPRSFSAFHIRLQSIGTSTSVIPINIQDWFALGLTSLISLLSKELSKFLSSTQFESIHFFMIQFSHLYMTTKKTIALTIWTFVDKVMSLLFNMLYRFVITFLPRRKCLLILWLKSLSAVILEPRK